MKKLTLILLSSLCIFACTKINRTENLLSKIDSLKVRNDSLIKVLSDNKPESNYWFDPDYEGEELKEKGISNPVEFIKNALRKKTELIPLKPVLGGTMYFSKIQLLSGEWLIADFEDGHIQGRGIYKFHLNKNDKLEFELLNSIGPE